MLTLASFFSAIAQNNISNKYEKQNSNFEFSEFKTQEFPSIKTTKSEQDHWLPDTVYCFTNGSGFNRYIYEYYSQPQGGLLALCYEQCQNESPCFLYTFTYDSNYNLLTELWQTGTNNSWEDWILYTHSYDFNNNKLTKQRYWWNGKLWSLNETFTFTYDFNNNLLIEQSLFTVYNYTYDSNNNLLTKLEKTMRNNLWENYSLTTYSYDLNNNSKTVLNYNWENDSWINTTKQEIIYDENGNDISAECWRWENGRWIPSHNSIYYLNTTIWLYYNDMHSVIEGRGCDKMIASYKKVSDIFTNIEQVTTSGLNKISIYPNPTKGELRIENGEWRIMNIQIFDIIGNKVLSPIPSPHWRGVSEGRGEVDISHLPAGIYFVQITTEKGIVTKKVVKR